jgi:hypothetical protein
MHPESSVNPIPRNRGRFYWQQLSGAIGEGAEMIYIAMFDEMDEGTAIFKTSKDPPGEPGKFVRLEKDIPADYYLFLTGMAAKMLKGQIPFQTEPPL